MKVKKISHPSKKTLKVKKTTGVTFPKPRDLDVCCGRGKGFFRHPGNRDFQKIVLANLERYSQACTKIEKSHVVSSIVKCIEGSGGRFVKKNPSTGNWYEIDDVLAHDKTGHAIRDHLLQSKRQAKGMISKKIKKTKKEGVNETDVCLSSIATALSCSFELLPFDYDFNFNPFQWHEKQPQQKSDEVIKLLSDSLPSASELIDVNFNESQGRLSTDSIDMLLEEQTAMNDGSGALLATTRDLSAQEVLDMRSLLSGGQPKKSSHSVAEIRESMIALLPQDWL
jgi:hypothetical protein